MLGICDLDREYTVWEAKESNPTRLNHDEHNVKLIMDQLNRFGAFKQVHPDLINLITMNVVPDDVRGKEQV